jgi:enoyl-CoA hydratase
MSDEVISQREGKVLLVTINRPQAKNAINRAVSEAIAAAVDELENNADLVIGIITGAGGSFCAGMDLKAFANGERANIPGRGFGGITEKPPQKPIIAAVEGYALAGGCEIVLSCDLVTAGDTAKFGLTETTRGLVAGAGGLFRLPQRIPPNIALEYALTGAHFTATQAHQWGLVNRLTPAGGALDAARELAQTIASNAPMAVRVTKQVIKQSADWPASESFDKQRSIIDPIFTSADAREGAVAFAEKRKPVWTGK